MYRRQSDSAFLTVTTSGLLNRDEPDRVVPVETARRGAVYAEFQMSEAGAVQRRRPKKKKSQRGARSSSAHSKDPNAAAADVFSKDGPKKRTRNKPDPRSSTKGKKTKTRKSRMKL